MSNVWQKRHH